MKPYRLINQSEILTLTEHFQQLIDTWNSLYCVIHLSMQLTTLPKQYSSTSSNAIVNEECHPLALIEGDYLSVIKRALFNDLSPCFDASAHELMLVLLKTLHPKTSCQWTEILKTPPSWFYSGSTCLVLILHCDQSQWSLILNPEWAYQLLPPPKAIANKKIDSLEDAVALSTLNLSLELSPCTLSLNSLAHLQVGDVLSTDHLLTTPLNVMQGTQSFAQAELGQSAQHKSILFTRSL